jgi:hypothetical protein
MAIQPHVKVYFDGGHRPVGMETAVVVRGRVFAARPPFGIEYGSRMAGVIRPVELAREFDLPLRRSAK